MESAPACVQIASGSARAAMPPGTAPHLDAISPGGGSQPATTIDSAAEITASDRPVIARTAHTIARGVCPLSRFAMVLRVRRRSNLRLRSNVEDIFHRLGARRRNRSEEHTSEL